MIRSVTNSTRRDGDEFLALAERIPIRTARELLRLEDANEALLSVKRASVRGAAVLTIR